MNNFALRVFKVADDADRAGNANKGTARNFLHASIFLEVLKQYGPLKEEVR
jgi:vacuolar protein sorting-associated protein VTA1